MFFRSTVPTLAGLIVISGVWHSSVSVGICVKRGNCGGLVEAWERTRESGERAVLKIKEARSEARGRKKEPSWTTTTDVA